MFRRRVMNAQSIVDRVWKYCDVLRDDGLSYGDYVEQLTYLIFLKMDYENVTILNQPSTIPDDLRWNSLLKVDGTELETQYLYILSSLGKRPGIIGVIFRKAQNRIQNPARLRRLIDLING